MEGIRSLEIDLDKDVVKINEKEVEGEVMVKLPGPERPYKYSKLFAKSDRDPGSRMLIDVDVSCYDTESKVV